MITPLIDGKTDKYKVKGTLLAFLMLWDAILPLEGNITVKHSKVILTDHVYPMVKHFTDTLESPKDRTIFYCTTCEFDLLKSLR